MQPGANACTHAHMHTWTHTNEAELKMLAGKKNREYKKQNKGKYVAPMPTIRIQVYCTYKFLVHVNNSTAFLS